MTCPLRFRVAVCLLPALMLPLPTRADDAGTERRYDLDREKVLYCIGYAHLDTQWRWDFTTTIDRYLRHTLEQNFDLFERYPGYVFNFTGSTRYAMMKEYYPALYDRLRKYVAAGRWHVSGSSVDEGDANVPSAEAMIRQVLYGNQFFRREFGKESVDFMLPDCFGFPASMPSIWAHCGLKGFSTQKLTWGSAVGIPFPIGVWEGPDGRSVIAALDPGPYSGGLQGRVDLHPEWVARVEQNGQRYGVWADYHYYGVGDQGGAPRAGDVQNYLNSQGNADGRITVALTASDQMFRDITEAQKARLPRYRGDLLLTQHSAGTLTSQAYMKRWNRQNELLADAAERAAVAADWLGGAAYPREKLYRSWLRVLTNQMHDILPGTSLPRAYTFSWNDEIVALNGFAAVAADSVGAVARGLDTRVQGQPLIVYNPLAIEREDVVEATVRYASQPPRFVSVFSAAGAPVPTQILERSDETLRILFLVRVPPVSWTVFDVRSAETAEPVDTGGRLRVTDSTLENGRYRVRIDARGDVAEIVDRRGGERALLAAPARLVFTPESPQDYPAWNMDWADRQKPLLGYVDGPPQIRVLEAGPVRVALEIRREARNSIIVQRVRLADGDAGDRIEFNTDVDWQSTGCALRAAFPLTVRNPQATYNWGLGTIERGNNEPTKYEVPAHEWFDLTDTNGAYGVSVLDDCKYGSDKPSDHELRLTLLYSPEVRKASFKDQHSQDWGRHEFTYALYAHAGDWRAGRSEWQARRLNQPLRAFQAEPHPGALGRTWSLLSLDTGQVDVRAVKLAEENNEIIVRVQELWGQEAPDVRLRFAAPIQAAREVDGQERPIGPARIVDGALSFALSPFSPKSFAVTLADPPLRLAAPESRPLVLDCDVDVISRDGTPADGAFDHEGRTLPAEQLPRALIADGVRFTLAEDEPGQPNALACRGQSLALPAGDDDRVCLLVAADEDVRAQFQVGARAQDVTVPAWTGFIGQWDDRLWDREFAEVDFKGEGQVVGFAPGYIKRAPIAWYCTHRHHPARGNEAYRFSYLFQLRLPRTAGEDRLVLPDDPRIKVFAISLAKHTNDTVTPAMPLYDDFDARPPLALRHQYPPPSRPPYTDATAAGRVVVDRAERFADLVMGAPSAADDVDQSRDTGLLFRFYAGDGRYPPHHGSGAVEDALPRLTDGAAARHDDDTDRCVWYDNEGRFYLDLQQTVKVRRINVFSWHRDVRAAQHFSVWGSDRAALPSLDLQFGAHADWTLLGVVDTKALGDGGCHGSSISAPTDSAALGPFRYLLWIAEDVGQGTFFTEIDVEFAE